ncbi:hypothetical protein ABLE94_02655 [Gordonia sp. VNK1]|uniref:hypothetical protein n=1 Tax=Gordonia oleivorans TaxID=3156618 RepID=UPI0032B5FB2F
MTVVVAALFYLVPIAVMALCIHLGLYAHPEPQPVATAAVTTVVPGDDNGDGIIDEDESGWDCATMGNRICGWCA